MDHGRQRATAMLPERAAFIVIKTARGITNPGFTTQLLGLCALASHFFCIEKHEVSG
jgi:hypothetical protein